MHPSYVAIHCRGQPYEWQHWSCCRIATPPPRFPCLPMSHEKGLFGKFHDHALPELFDVSEHLDSVRLFFTDDFIILTKNTEWCQSYDPHFQAVSFFHICFFCTFHDFTKILILLVAFFNANRCWYDIKIICAMMEIFRKHYLKIHGLHAFRYYLTRFSIKTSSIS